jgi:hypothetical protein
MAVLLFAQSGEAQTSAAPRCTDFCCVERRLVVEPDGSQHAAMPEEDLRRTQFLQSRGYNVLRFWDTEVLQQLAAARCRGRSDPPRAADPLTLTLSPYSGGEGIVANLHYFGYVFVFMKRSTKSSACVPVGTQAAERTTGALS